jgi:hypothetical protein
MPTNYDEPSASGVQGNNFPGMNISPPSTSSGLSPAIVTQIQQEIANQSATLTNVTGLVGVADIPYLGTFSKNSLTHEVLPMGDDFALQAGATINGVATKVKILARLPLSPIGKQKVKVQIETGRHVDFEAKLGTYTILPHEIEGFVEPDTDPANVGFAALYIRASYIKNNHTTNPLRLAIIGGYFAI